MGAAWLEALHQHVPEAARLFKQSHTSHVIESGISAEQMVASMDAAGVERAMLCAWHRPGKSLTSNDEIAEIVARFPDRFVGVAAVNLEKPVEAVRELDRAVKELGFKACESFRGCGSAAQRPALLIRSTSKCIELDIPFCTQVGHTGPLIASEPAPGALSRTKSRLLFPESRIVGGHIGDPGPTR